MSAPPFEIAVLHHVEGWPDAFDDLAETAILAALQQAGVKQTGPAEVTVVLTDDEEQQVLNRDWRSIDKSTNVLSFPQLEPFAPLAGLIGDITLARETVVREAADLGIALEAHFTHLVVHGFLHLLGHDHIADDEAERMEGLETSILETLGIADPYLDE